RNSNLARGIESKSLIMMGWLIFSKNIFIKRYQFPCNNDLKRWYRLAQRCETLLLFMKLHLYLRQGDARFSIGVQKRG
ncbi:hypothetical protein AAULR_02814, partial [Lacticaseibacillus rhamnosus MTCC 5462]